ncbi:MAG: TetR/AcrR family transcriptional regulator [Acidimicrobiia bacterium]
MSLREVRHRAAQRLVIDAAFELMLERGYAATTMTAIADHAGVAERTVYNLFGSKAGLMLSTLRDRGSGGAVDELAADHEHMWSLDDPLEIIEYAVETNHRVASRAITLFQVAYQAAAVEQEVAVALEELEEIRFHHQGELIDMLQEKGHLREDIPYELIKRGFWLMAGPETVIKAMKAGWDLDTYSSWLRTSLPSLLLPSKRTY